MDLYIHDLPSQLLSLTQPIADVLLPLQQVSPQPLRELVGPAEHLHLLECWLDHLQGGLKAFSERAHCLVADLLADDELVFADLLIGISLALL